MRRQGISNDIGAFRLSAVVIAWSRLVFGIGFDHKPTEIGNAAIDAVHLLLPPSLQLRIGRIGGLELAQLNRRAELGGDIDTNPIGPQHCRQRRHFLHIHGQQHPGVGGDIV
jgi:hypothetical protein